MTTRKNLPPDRVMEIYQTVTAPLWTGPETVADYIKLLSEFPPERRVMVSTPAGGGIAVERRDVKGEPVVAIFGKNGGSFGENPLTEEEYAAKSEEFLRKIQSRDYMYTTAHGDHRLCFLMPGVQVDTCYGDHYDERIIDRMVKEGLLEYFKQPYSRDGVRPKIDWTAAFGAKE